jgi:23S rRNA pseudouridine2605 synthase
MTYDGELKRAMELPANGVPRTYRARTFGDISQARLEELMEGVEIEGIRYGPINANLERSAGRNKWIELTLSEGKNREVRRVLEYLGLEVSRLLRLRYGPFDLGELPRGGAEEVPQVVVERFCKGLSGDVATRQQQAIHAGKAIAPRKPAPAAAPVRAAPARGATAERAPFRQERKPTPRPESEPERPTRARPIRVMPSAEAGHLVDKPSAPRPAARTFPNRPYAKPAVEGPSPGPDARAPRKTPRSAPRKPGGKPGSNR